MRPREPIWRRWSPPVTFLGALVYYRNGYVAIKPALIIILGLCLGILGGSYLARPYSKSLFNHEEHEVHEGILKKQE